MSGSGWKVLKKVLKLPFFKNLMQPDNKSAQEVRQLIFPAFFVIINYCKYAGRSRVHDERTYLRKVRAPQGRMPVNGR